MTLSQPSVPSSDRLLRAGLRLRHLQLLIALEEYRHVGRASAALSLTQPAASKMLAEVERQFQERLFVRSSRGTEPTAQGLAAVRFARSVLADYERTRQEFAALRDGFGTRVNLGAMMVATPVWLARSIRAMKQRSPQTILAIEEGDLSRLLPRLRGGEIDLIAGRLETGYSAPDLEVEPLFDEPMVLVVAPDHPLASQPRPDWALLSQQPWVVPPRWAATRPKLDQVFLRHRLPPPKDLIETSSYLMTATFVREQRALGFIARSVARQLAKDGLAITLDLKLPIALPPVGLIRLQGRVMPAAVEMLIDCLRRHAPSPGRRRVAAAH